MTVEIRQSLTTVSERTGTPRSTVHYRARGEGRNGYVTEGRDGRRYASPKVRAKRIVEHRRLRAEGLTEREIAESTGWPRGTVNRDLRAADPACTVSSDSSLPPQGSTSAPQGAPKSKIDQGSDMAQQSFIRRLRRERGLTQRELAERTGLSEHGIARLDRGEVEPRRSSALLLAAALGCRPADLRGGS